MLVFGGSGIEGVGVKGIVRVQGEPWKVGDVIVKESGLKKNADTVPNTFVKIALFESAVKISYTCLGTEQNLQLLDGSHLRVQRRVLMVKKDNSTRIVICFRFDNWSCTRHERWGRCSEAEYCEAGFVGDLCDAVS